MSAIKVSNNKNFYRKLEKVSLITWMVSMVVSTVVIFSFLGGMYYLSDYKNSQNLKKNSTYITVKTSVLKTQNKYAKLSSFVSYNAQLDEKQIIKKLNSLSKSIKELKEKNTVSALDNYITNLESSSNKLNSLVNSKPIDKKSLNKTLSDVGNTLDTLYIIADEGSKAEWKNLINNNQNDFQIILSIILVGVMLVCGIGSLIINIIHNILKNVIAINTSISNGQTEIEIPEHTNKTQIGKLYGALKVFRNLTVERKSLQEIQEKEQTTRIERQKRVETIINDFRGQMSDVLDPINTNVDEMLSIANSLTKVSQETSGKAEETSELTRSSSNKAQSVAAATEELSATIGEVSLQVGEANSTVLQVTQEARQTNEKVSELSDAANKIGEIMTIIQDIAEQTNLLALNATIEAARAGEMGKGFAVVASEVKTLANQTAKATEEISSQISAIQNSTGEAVSAIQSISNMLESVNESTTTISGAIEQQRSATNEISHNITEVSSGMSNVVENVGGVTAVASEANQTAAYVRNVSSDVAERTKQLQKTVDQFLDQVASV